MIKEEVYKKISNHFGCSVGLATQVHFIGLASDEAKNLPKEMRGRVSDEVIINYIIEDCVWEGRYQQLRRGVLEAEKRKHPKTKEVTIYKKLSKR